MWPWLRHADLCSAIAWLHKWARILSGILIAVAVFQAEFGDDALHQLRKREAEERRAAVAAAQQKIDTNQIPLGQRVMVCAASSHPTTHPPGSTSLRTARLQLCSQLSFIWTTERVFRSYSLSQQSLSVWLILNRARR